MCIRSNADLVRSGLTLSGLTLGGRKDACNRVGGKAECWGESLLMWYSFTEWDCKCGPDCEQRATGSYTAEHEPSLEEVVDTWHIHLHYDRRVLLCHLPGAHSSVSAGPGHTHQVFPRDHLHWLQ